MKYVVRVLKENAYYHIYNKGVDGKEIFRDKQDYETFLFYLLIYTLSQNEVQIRYPTLPKRLSSKNLSEDLKLVAYCLMPNHFHLIIRQKSPNSMPKLLKQITNAYATYFNKKYQTKGRVTQGRYLAVKVENELLVLQLVRYVHINPSMAGLCVRLSDYQWSSYNDHSLNNDVYNRFGNLAEWEKFHQDNVSYLTNLPKIKHLTID